jgi:hypothetical protein
VSGDVRIAPETACTHAVAGVVGAENVRPSARNF